mgnify:CR=1 FL=1|jgi:hypothetical protein
MDKETRIKVANLWIEVDVLQEKVLEKIVTNGNSWLLSDEFNALQSRIDEIDFEIDLLELLDSKGIKN